MMNFFAKPSQHEDEGNIEREPSSRLDTGFLTGLIAMTAYLAIWWSQLPSVEAVTNGGAERNAWTTSSPLLGMAVPFALAGLAAAFLPALRAGLSARLSLVRWPLLIGLLVASLALGTTAPTLYQVAAQTRLAREADAANKARFELLMKQAEAARQDALEIRNKDEREARLRLIAEQEANIRNLRQQSQAELSKQLQTFQDAANKADDESKAKAKELENQLAQQKKAVDEAEAARKAAETKLASGNKEGTGAGDATAGSTPFTPPPTGPGAGPKNGGDDPMQQFVGGALAMTAFAINPALGMIFASMLGITMGGTDYKTAQDSGRAIIDCFPGGKFDPTKAKLALEGLAGQHPTGDAQRIAAEILAEYMKHASKAEAVEIAAFLPKLDGMFSPDKVNEALARLIEPHWDGIVGASPTAENLAKLIQQVEGVNRAIKSDVLRAAVVRFARGKGVPESVLTQFESAIATASAPPGAATE